MENGNLTTNQGSSLLLGRVYYNIVMTMYDYCLNSVMAYWYWGLFREVCPIYDPYVGECLLERHLS